jgi:hypothetical protein
MRATTIRQGSATSEFGTPDKLHRFGTQNSRSLPGRWKLGVTLVFSALVRVLPRPSPSPCRAD